VSRSTRHDAGLPPPLMTSEPGSFARFTIVERKPRIIRQVIEDNDYPPHIVLGVGSVQRGDRVASLTAAPCVRCASPVE